MAQWILCFQFSHYLIQRVSFKMMIDDYPRGNPELNFFQKGSAILRPFLKAPRVSFLPTLELSAHGTQLWNYNMDPLLGIRSWANLYSN